MSKELQELIAATSWFWIFSIGFLLSIFTSIYITICTSYWWILILYVFWIIHDRKISDQGGRRIEWVRKWSWWGYMKNYFNFKLTTEEGCELNPNKNYIFACFPHGIQPVGTFASFINGYQNFFPDHTPFNAVLNVQFWMPLMRELFLAIGAVSVSAASLKYLLSGKGGNIVAILIGGADEIQYSKPGKYKIILKKRKGFVKMALQTGSPLVPVVSFGETDAFDQITFPGFNLIRDFIKKTTQVGIVIPFGTYFVCPNKVPVTTVVGKPIDVEKTENPTMDQINALHQKFMDNITKLFEDHKQMYVKEPSTTFLEIV